jgi:hypothetical protein
MKDSTNGKEPTRTPRIQRPNSCAKKHGGSDIDWFNPFGDQFTHFVGYTEVLMFQTPLLIAKM